MSAALAASHVAALTGMLCALIARHGLARRLAGPLIVLIWSRVRGIGAQLETLLARLRAGQLRRHPARRLPRQAAAPRRRPAASALPRPRAWLIRLIPQTAASAAQLQTLLADPEIPALLHAAPQLRRALRPLCHMLGVTLPRPDAPPDAPPDDPPDAPPDAPRPASDPPAMPPPWPTAPPLALAAPPPARSPPPGGVPPALPTGRKGRARAPFCVAFILTSTQSGQPG